MQNGMPYEEIVVKSVILHIYANFRMQIKTSKHRYLFDFAEISSNNHNLHETIKVYVSLHASKRESCADK